MQSPQNPSLRSRVIVLHERFANSTFRESALVVALQNKAPRLCEDSRPQQLHFAQIRFTYLHGSSINCQLLLRSPLWPSSTPDVLFLVSCLFESRERAARERTLLSKMKATFILIGFLVTDSV
jgi:hypothetical protein